MRPTAAALALAAALAGCAAPGAPDRGVPSAGAPARAAAPADGPIAPFSKVDVSRPGGPWAEWRLHPTKRPTRFSSVDADGVRVVQAELDSSVSGLRHLLDVDPARQPILEWRWRIDRTLDGADVGTREGDDSPVRIVLAFDGDVSTLPLAEQAFFERVKLFGGQDMPYATLMYVWCNHRAPGSIATNAHTTRVKKIVVESGQQGVRAWRSYRRDIVADYERAFGRKPGRLIAVGVMSDADNTRQRGRGWYGDIRLSER